MLGGKLWNEAHAATRLLSLDVAYLKDNSDH